MLYICCTAEMFAELFSRQAALPATSLALMSRCPIVIATDDAEQLTSSPLRRTSSDLPTARHRY